MRRTTKIAAAFTLAALVLVLAWACSEPETQTPSGPSPVLAPSSSSSGSSTGNSGTNPTNPTNPTPAPAPAGEITATRPAVSGSTASSTFSNSTQRDEQVRLCSYECLTGDCRTGEQKLFRSDVVKDLDAGKDRTLEVEIACVFQVDAFEDISADAKCPDRVTYETDFSKYGLNLLEAKIGSRKNDPDCKETPGCPANSWAQIEAKFVPQQSVQSSACPPNVLVSWTSSVIVGCTKTEILPIPPLNVTGPGVGTLPVKEEDYSVEFNVEGRKDGKICATGNDILEIKGCKDCKECETSTKVSLKNELIKDGQADAYRVRTSFVMGPPGKYRLVVSQGPNVLRDTTSSIQQAYLSPGAAETPLPCGSASVNILFEVIDDKCGSDVVCETYRDTIKIPKCELSCDDWAKTTSVDPHPHANGMFAGNWVIDTNYAGNFADTAGNGHAFGTGHDEADYEYAPTGSTYSVTGTWTVLIDEKRCQSSESMKVPPCVEPPEPKCEWGPATYEGPPVCEWTCPECELKPFADRWTVNVTNERIDAYYYGNNEGTWVLSLYAGTYSNPKRYKKDTDTVRVKCGDDSQVKVGYRHKGHDACLWTLIGSGPGFSKSEVVLDRCN